MGSNPDPSTELLNFMLVVGGGCQMLFGALALFVGYLVTVHDVFSSCLTAVLIGLIQLAWVPFVTGMLLQSVSEPRLALLNLERMSSNASCPMNRIG
jgi:hypothetical protein